MRQFDQCRPVGRRNVLPRLPIADRRLPKLEALGPQSIQNVLLTAEQVENDAMSDRHKPMVITKLDNGKHKLGLAHCVLFAYADAMSVGERIRIQRKAAKRSQQWLADRIGVSQNTISGWEKGRTEPGRDDVAKIATVLAVDISLLELGDDNHEAHKVRVMGLIGAGQAIEPLPTNDPLEWVLAPPGAPDGAHAAIVRGGSMYPLLRDGFMLVWWRLTPDPTPHLGELCYCELDTGDMLVKIVEPGSRRGRFTLVSLQQGYEPMRDVRLKNVAPVEIIYRREPRA